MGEFVTVARKPVFILAVILAFIAEFVILEGVVGISFPSDRSSVASSYEIREKGTELHFITQQAIQYYRSI